jgi:hypothetical protein
MVGKAAVGNTEVDVINKLKADQIKENNMRRQNLSLLNSQTAQPRGIGIGGAGIDGSGQTTDDTPVIINVTDVDLLGNDTGIYNRLNWAHQLNVVVDDSLTAPGTDINLKYIENDNLLPGDEIRIKVRNARELIIEEAGNIVIPENRDTFTLQDNVMVIFQYYANAFAQGVPGWILAGTQFIPDYEINQGIFPIPPLGVINVQFGASYINPPVVTTSYQADVGQSPIHGISIATRLTVDGNGLYDGCTILLTGPNLESLNLTGQFISVHAVVRL